MGRRVAGDLRAAADLDAQALKTHANSLLGEGRYEEALAMLYRARAESPDAEMTKLFSSLESRTEKKNGQENSSNYNPTS